MAQANKKRVRSPNYPAIGLEEALAKLRVLYDKETVHPTPVETASKHWEYKSLGAGGGLIVAALSAYNLVNVEGSGNTRKIAVNDTGRHLLLDTRADSPERAGLLKQAALSPKIHSELWQKWGHQLPSDESMQHYLVVDRHFNVTQVRHFIEQYKATLRFTGVSDSDSLEKNMVDTGLAQQAESKIAMELSALSQDKQQITKAASGENKISFSFPYRGSTLTVHIEVSGHRLTPAHIASIRKHLELTESDLIEEEE